MSMRCHLKVPVKNSATKHEATYTLNGYFEDGLFHDPTLNIAVTSANIYFIETAPAPEPIKLDRTAVKVLPAKPATKSK